MKPLELRKRLLVSESELNRDQLTRQWAALTMGVRVLAGHVRPIDSIVSKAVLLVAGVAALWRRKPGGAEVHPSKLRTLLKVSGLAAVLWRRYRAKAPSLAR